MNPDDGTGLAYASQEDAERAATALNHNWLAKWNAACAERNSAGEGTTMPLHYETPNERRLRYLQYGAAALALLIAVGGIILGSWGLSLPDPSEVGR